MGITPYALARAILVDPPRIDAIIKGGRRITTDTAVSLSGFFGTTPGFWMNMQSRYDLETLMEEKEPSSRRLAGIAPFPAGRHSGRGCVRRGDPPAVSRS